HRPDHATVSCHSHPESANDLFSTLGLRVQADGRALGGDSGHAKARRPAALEPGPPRYSAKLDRADCLSLRPTVALSNLEFDPLALLKRPVAVRLNSREVDEDVSTTVDRDEAVALIRVEPFDGALSHEQQLPNFCSGFGSRPCLRNPLIAERA